MPHLEKEKIRAGRGGYRGAWDSSLSLWPGPWMLRHGCDLCSPHATLFQVQRFCKCFATPEPRVQTSICKWTENRFSAGLGDNPGVTMLQLKKKQKWRCVNLHPLPFIVNKQRLQFSFRMTKAIPVQTAFQPAWYTCCYDELLQSDFWQNEFSLKWT